MFRSHGMHPPITETQQAPTPSPVPSPGFRRASAIRRDFPKEVTVRPEGYTPPSVTRIKESLDADWLFKHEESSAVNYGTSIADESGFTGVTLPHTWFPTNTAYNKTPPLGGGFKKLPGLTGNASVIYANPVHADLEDFGSPGVYLTPTRIGETSTWNLNLKSDIINDGDTEKKVTVKTTLRKPESFDLIEGIPEEHLPFDISSMYGNEVYLTDEKEVTLAAGKNPFNLDLSVENPRLWNGRLDPFLYQVDFEIYDGERAFSIQTKRPSVTEEASSWPAPSRI